MKRALILLAALILVTGCATQQQETPKEILQEPPAQAGWQGPSEQDLKAQCPSFKFPPDCNTVPDQGGRDMCERCKPFTQIPVETKGPAWKKAGIAVAGTYADAELVEMDGKYRMYYSAEPEVQGFEGQVYSVISTDGKTWTIEDGTRKTWSTFPSVTKLDSGYRMYFQNAGAIKSASSTDGLAWTDDSGTRMDKSNDAGLELENVAAPTIMKSGDEYLMVYRGTINEKYPENVPNDKTELLLWATSTDGLTFEKKGIAIDSRNAKFKGLLDGPELVKWDDGSTRLYFWSYKGVYHSTYSNGKFSEAELDFSTDPGKEFPMDPPGDPTLMKIGGKWHMYYGQHTKGIYYATLE